MLTNNGKAYLLPAKIMSGATDPEIKLMASSGSALFHKMSTIKTGPRICLGSGSDPAAADDYSLGSRITTLTLVSEEATEGAYNSRSYEDHMISAYTATFRNDTENTITVAEVGVIVEFNQVWLGGEYILLSRDVINPVSIAPGKTYAFSVVWG